MHTCGSKVGPVSFGVRCERKGKREYQKGIRERVGGRGRVPQLGRRSYRGLDTPLASPYSNGNTMCSLTLKTGRPTRVPTLGCAAGFQNAPVPKAAT